MPSYTVGGQLVHEVDHRHILSVMTPVVCYVSLSSQCGTRCRLSVELAVVVHRLNVSVRRGRVKFSCHHVFALCFDDIGERCCC